jgi:hypothetical protein
VLTARSVVITAVAIAVLSIIGMVINLMLPPDSGGWGRDSYGTRALGQRALYELAEELNVPVERGLVPPTGVIHREITLVFLSPDPELVNIEPDHLHKVAQWVRDGSFLVVAPAKSLSPKKESNFSQRRHSFFQERSLLEELGLTDVSVTTLGKPADGDDQSAGSDENEPGWKWRWTVNRPPPMQRISVAADGRLSYLNNLVGSLQVPQTELQVIAETSKAPPSGRVFWRADDGSEKTVVALYPLGNGEVMVVSDPSLLLNFSIAGEDNAVLAAHLLARSGRPVVFDEFYHGLTVRGNPFWLLTRYPYGLLAALLVLAGGLWAWRGMVHLGPPLAERVSKRRTLSEYVEAMANIFHRGKCRAFVLQETRDGVLWALRKRFHLSPGQQNTEAIAQAMSRRDPENAERLLKATAEIDLLMKGGKRLAEHRVVRAAGEITQCL